MTDIDNIELLPEPSKIRLNDPQQVDYELHREELLTWALERGKDPDTKDGYSFETVRTRAHRLDEFYRWVWERDGEYTTHMTPEDATGYLRHLANSESSNSYKSSVKNSIRMLFKCRNHEKGDDVEWNAEIDYTTGGGTEPPTEILTREEIGKLKNAAEEYGSIPHYNSLSPEERDQWKGYLAQRLSKSKDEIVKADWDRVNGFKYESLLKVAYEAALRPWEVKQASLEWIDTENWILRIPKDAGEDRSAWKVALTEETAAVLRAWLNEREQYEKYDGTEALWLTRERNRYETKALNYLFD